VLLALGAWSPARAAAQAPDRPLIDVVQAGGLLDPINVSLLGKVIDQAPGRGTSLIVVQLDSGSATASQAAVDGVIAKVKASTVPVAVWVGPIGRGKAQGRAYDLYRAADLVGGAPSVRIGPRGGGLGAIQLPRDHVVSPTLPDFIGRLDGRQAKGRTIATAEPRVEGGPFELRRDIEIRFRNPALVDRALHALGSPSATYFLVVGGLLLFLFELFSAGVGIAAVSAALCLALSAYGLGTLGTQPIGLVLLGVATFGFGVDIQSGEPRAWTGIGAVALAAGSVTLFDSRRPSWLALLLVIGGALLIVLFAIPSTVRTRFSTPTIGRDDLIGSTGTAVTAISPEGTVEVRGAPWRARTFPAAIPAGAVVEVVAIEGLVLEVVPEGTELLPPRHPG
jgi:membrane-bound serine protease (ClpP class)